MENENQTQNDKHAYLAVFIQSIREFFNQFGYGAISELAWLPTPFSEFSETVIVMQQSSHPLRRHMNWISLKFVDYPIHGYSVHYGEWQCLGTVASERLDDPVFVARSNTTGKIVVFRTRWIDKEQVRVTAIAEYDVPISFDHAGDVSASTQTQRPYWKSQHTQQFRLVDGRDILTAQQETESKVDLLSNQLQHLDNFIKQIVQNSKEYRCQIETRYGDIEKMAGHASGNARRANDLFTYMQRAIKIISTPEQFLSGDDLIKALCVATVENRKLSSIGEKHVKTMVFASQKVVEHFEDQRKLMGGRSNVFCSSALGFPYSSETQFVRVHSRHEEMDNLTVRLDTSLLYITNEEWKQLFALRNSVIGATAGKPHVEQVCFIKMDADMYGAPYAVTYKKNDFYDLVSLIGSMNNK